MGQAWGEVRQWSLLGAPAALVVPNGHGLCSTGAAACAATQMSPPSHTRATRGNKRTGSCPQQHIMALFFKMSATVDDWQAKHATSTHLHSSILPPIEYVPAGHRWQAPEPLRLPNPALQTVHGKAAHHKVLMAEGRLLGAHAICSERAEYYGRAA